MPVQVKRRGNFYYVGDKKFTRVTTILDVIAKPALVPWAARQAATILLAEPPERLYEYTPDEIVNKVFVKRDDAANLGREAHSILNAFAKGVKIDVAALNPNIKGFVKAGLLFYETLNYKKILYSEISCYSAKYGYGGQTDLIIELQNEEIWLYDFKTGGLYKEAALQLVAYKQAVLEMGLVERIDNTALVQLNANGLFAIKPCNEPLEAFLNAKGLYEWSINCSFY